MKKDKQNKEDPYSKMTIDELTALAEQGDAEAQCELGYRYKKGKGVDQDYKKAAKCFAKSAKQGYMDAQFNIGACYYMGCGVKQDYKKALEW